MYTLLTVLNNRDLRRELANNGFGFQDGNGVFPLDFQEESFLKNHRKTFNILWTLGGEALFQKLLKEDCPCLEKGSSKGKKGVRPIEGTESFSLKTNAGNPTVMTSILSGIAAWADMNQDFDPEKVLLFDPEEQTELPAESAAATEPAAPEQPAAREFLWWTKDHSVVADRRKPRFLTPRQENGVWRFYQEDTGEQVVLQTGLYEDGQELSDLLCLEELRDGENTLLGYRYRLEEQGKWGFISPYFLSVTEPIYDWVLPLVQNRYGYIRGVALLQDVSEKDKPQLLIKVTQELEYSAEDEAALREEPLVEYCVEPMEISGESFLWNGHFDAEALSPWCFQDILHQRLLVGISAASCDRAAMDQSGMLSVQNKTLYLEHQRAADCYRLPLAVEQDNAAEAFEAYGTLLEELRKGAYRQKLGSAEVEEQGFMILRHQGWESITAVEKEGNGFPLAPVLVQKTPEAFTSVEYLGDGCFLVDRFGKKGVYDGKHDSYPVPCDYEKIERRDDGSFEVERMGFRGSICRDGSWEQPLSRF